jgi:glucose/arabinose dehydrogenase
MEVRMYKRARRSAIAAASVALAAAGIAGVAAATSATAATATSTIRYYAFDINNGTTDPGLIPVAGSNPATFAQGDELILNDQVTTTHWAGHGYPIVGFDSGVCTMTRIPEKNAEQTLANCVVSVTLTGGSLTVQGAVQFKSGLPQPATLAVTGGTGKFDGKTGQVRVSFTKTHKILVFSLR